MYRIQILLLILVCVTASADHHGEGPPNSCHIYYPNIPGEVLLENDKLVVQRFIIEPGQFEGIHRHPPNQLYIQLTDGDWRYKIDDSASDFSLPAGAASWNETSTPLSANHESGNIGDEPITYIWVGVKPGCAE